MPRSTVALLDGFLYLGQQQRSGEQPMLYIMQFVLQINPRFLGVDYNWPLVRVSDKRQRTVTQS